MQIPHPNTFPLHQGLKFLLLFVCIFALVTPTLRAESAGGTVRIAWDPNPEKELAGYKVHYGTASGSYDRSIDVGNTPTVALSGLTLGTTYYVAVTAYSSLAIESEYSEEISVVVEPPTLPPGTGRIVLLEAENGTLESPMSTGSGDGLSWVSTSTAGAGLVSMPFESPASSDYKVWCRYRTTSGGTPTVLAAFDTQDETSLRLPASGAGVWTWGQLSATTGEPWGSALEQGAHSLHLRIGSSGLQIDRVVLSSDANFAASDELPRSGDVVLITAYPQNRAVPGGSTASFSVSAAGTGPIEFQWMKNGSPIEGATSSELTVGPVTAADAGQYSVTATSGSASQTAGPALLAITGPPLAIRSLNISAPGNVTFEVEGAVGTEIRVYASSDLEEWDLVATRLNESGVITVEDPGAAGATKRFYRLADDS